jgi:hypothetical protein
VWEGKEIKSFTLSAAGKIILFESYWFPIIKIMEDLQGKNP